MSENPVTTLPPAEAIAKDVVRDDTAVTTAETQSSTREVIEIYRDAGAVGVAMISLVLILIIMALLLFRVVKMYVELSGARDTNEGLRMQTYSALASQIVEMRTDVRDLRNTVQVIVEKDEAAKNGEKIQSVLDILNGDKNRSRGIA